MKKSRTIDIEKLEWHTEARVIDDLVPHETNPRKLTEKQAADLKESIERFNFVEIPAINANGTILAGHQRLATMKSLGRGGETIDVRVPSRPLTEREEREYLVRSNKNTGEWDFDILTNEFDLDDLKSWGFDSEEFALAIEVDPDTTGDDEVGDPPPDPITRPGDIYQMNDHRLICGDSRDAGAIGNLLGERVVDLVITDPPYGVNYQGVHGSARKKIENDALSHEETQRLFSDAMSIIPLKPGGSFYVFCPAGDLERAFRDGLIDSGLQLRQGLAMVKNQFVMGRSDYHYKHESILYGWKEGTHYFVDDRTQCSVIECKKPSKSKDHPTMKPVEVIDLLIKNSSVPGALVYDAFSGSGTTLISCEKQRRIFAGVEIDPAYCDVIVRRWMKFCADNGRETDLKRNGEKITCI